MPTESSSSPSASSSSTHARDAPASHVDRAGDAPRAPLEVICFGETIVDFLPDRRARLRDVESFQRVVGGAPANVALGLARLGRRSGMIGRVGADEFGCFLREELEREGVDMRGMHVTRDAPTGFTFISLTEDGERSFTSVIARTADQTWRIEDLDPMLLDEAPIMVFGSNQMTERHTRHAVLEAMGRARKARRFIVFDPNVRLHLWSEPAQARPSVLEAMRHVDVVKLNDEEMEFLCPGLTPRQIFEQELAPCGVDALITTHAAGGAHVITATCDITTKAPPTLRDRHHGRRRWLRGGAGHKPVYGSRRRATRRRRARADRLVGRVTLAARHQARLLCRLSRLHHARRHHRPTVYRRRAARVVVNGYRSAADRKRTVSGSRTRRRERRRDDRRETDGRRFAKRKRFDPTIGRRGGACAARAPQNEHGSIRRRSKTIRRQIENDPIRRRSKTDGRRRINRPQNEH